MSGQLEQWLNGNPMHDKERDLCCPDFSCCSGRISPIDQRERFVKAVNENDEHTKNEMLGMFLCEQFAGAVYVAGLSNEGHGQ